MRASATLAEKFQSTLPVWGVTNWGRSGDRLESISIHTPRVGSDPRLSVSARRAGRISIHTPRVGSDTPKPAKDIAGRLISIHTPRVGSDCVDVLYNIGFAFQSTLPVWGVTAQSVYCTVIVVFQSTLPVWGVTYSVNDPEPCRGISIHTPRVGSDRSMWLTSNTGSDFNPHSPCGE